MATFLGIIGCEGNTDVKNGSEGFYLAVLCIVRFPFYLKLGRSTAWHLVADQCKSQ